MSNLREIIDKAQTTKCPRCNNNYNFIVFDDICNYTGLGHTMYDIEDGNFIDNKFYSDSEEKINYLKYDLRYWYNYNFVFGEDIYKFHNKIKINEVESSNYHIVHTCFNIGFNKYSDYYVYETSIYIYEYGNLCRFIHDIGLEKNYMDIKYPYSSTTLKYFSTLTGDKYIICDILNPGLQRFDLEPNTLSDYFGSLDINRSIKMMEDIKLLG